MVLIIRANNFKNLFIIQPNSLKMYTYSNNVELSLLVVYITGQKQVQSKPIITRSILEESVPLSYGALVHLGSH